MQHGRNTHQGEIKALRATLRQQLRRGDLHAQSSTYSALGRAYLELDEYIHAYECFADAFQIAEELGSRHMIAETLRGFGLLYRLLGDTERALKFFTRSHAQLDDGSPPALLRNLLGDIGTTHFQNGDLHVAVDYLKRSLAIDNGDDPTSPFPLLRLAQALATLGDLDEAQHYAEQGLEASEIHAEAAIQFLAMMAVIAEMRGELQSAGAHYRRALRLCQTVPDPAYHAAIALLLGDFHRSGGHDRKAIVFYEQAVKSAKSAGNRYWTMKGTVALASLYESRGEEGKALAWYRRYIEASEGTVNYIRQATLEGMQAFWRFEMVAKRQDLYRHSALLLEQEVARKREELAVSALQLVHNAKLVEELQSELRDLSTALPQKARRPIAAISKRLAGMYDARSGWNQFERQLNLTDPGFMREISSRYPALTPVELKVCALLRINLSSKEIASLLGISPTSVDTYRSRIRRKIGLPPDSNLTIYLSAL